MTWHCKTTYVRMLYQSNISRVTLVSLLKLSHILSQTQHTFRIRSKMFTLVLFCYTQPRRYENLQCTTESPRRGERKQKRILFINLKQLQTGSNQRPNECNDSWDSTRHLTRLPVSAISRRDTEKPAWKQWTSGTYIHTSIGEFLCETFRRFVKWPTQIFPSGNTKHFRAENQANEIPPESPRFPSCLLDTQTARKQPAKWNFHFKARCQNPSLRLLLTLSLSLSLPLSLFLSLSSPFFCRLCSRVSVFIGRSLFREKDLLLPFISAIHARLRGTRYVFPGHATRGWPVTTIGLSIFLSLSLCFYL